MLLVHATKIIQTLHSGWHGVCQQTTRMRPQYPNSPLWLGWDVPTRSLARRQYATFDCNDCSASRCVVDRISLADRASLTSAEALPRTLGGRPSRLDFARSCGIIDPQSILLLLLASRGADTGLARRCASGPVRAASCGAPLASGAEVGREKLEFLSGSSRVHLRRSAGTPSSLAAVGRPDFVSASTRFRDAMPGGCQADPISACRPMLASFIMTSVTSHFWRVRMALRLLGYRLCECFQ